MRNKCAWIYWNITNGHHSKQRTVLFKNTDRFFKCQTSCDEIPPMAYTLCLFCGDVNVFSLQLVICNTNNGFSLQPIF